jgi:site-specific DNA-methyltransferase (adenine-specific)
VLKPTGSLYLHCDPTASHFLKLMLDGIFSPLFFKNEIIWKRTTAHSNVYSNYGDVTDSIFFYVKSDSYTWNQLYRKVDDVKAAFPNVDSNGRRWRSENMRNPGVRPNLHYPYTASNGITYQPHPNGWTVSLEKMQKLDSEGRLHFPSKPSGRLRLKYYADEHPGIKLQTLLGDVENQKAAGGVLITLEKPSKQMRTEAADAGRYMSKLWHDKDYPRIQILTVEGLLNGTERIDAPPQINPFAMAARESSREKQTEML